LVSRFTDQPIFYTNLKGINNTYNDYYPSPEMHLDAANLLELVCRKYSQANSYNNNSTVCKQEQINKTLLILSIQRTGSTFLWKVISSLQEFEFFGEVYHPQKVYVPYHRKLELVEYISRQKDINITIGKTKIGGDLELVKFAHEFPEVFFESIHQTSNSDYFGFKIFQNHLDLNTINNVFLNNKNVVKLILKRNFLDVYASICIQRKIKEIETEVKKQKIKKSTYYNFDTTNIKVLFKPSHFIKWLNKVQKYYAFLEKASRHDPDRYLFLNYEEINQYQTDYEKFLFVVDFLSKSGFNIDKNQKEQQPELLKKQDSRANILDKFENPEDLKKLLAENNLEYLLDNSQPNR
jgi:hypothetical protein